MTETTRENSAEQQGRGRRSGPRDTGAGAAVPPAAGLAEDQLFEDPFDRPKESAR